MPDIIMIELFKRVFGTNENNRLKNSEFSKFVYDISITQKRRIIEEAVKDANREQKELVERVERIRN